MILFVVVFVWVYGIVLLYFTKVWNSIPLEKTAFYQKNIQACSIIIPFRNEANSLVSLLDSIRLIDYSKEHVEFHFIDDHSSDESLSILNQGLDVFPFKFYIHQLPEEITGKKNAQILGIEKSNFDIIICTDADCVVPVNWVEKMLEGFSNPAIHMLTGNVSFKGETFWSKLMSIEFAPLIGITGVGIYLNHPIMANGANMAFRKSSFLNVLQYRSDIGEIASGDDIFLLEALKKTFGDSSIGFVKNSVVQTAPPANLRSFFNQRIRWASKWNKQASIWSSLSALLLWIFHLILTVSIIYCLKEGSWIAFACLLVPKGICEYIFIDSIFKSYPKKINGMEFTLVMLFYSFYVIFFGLTANFGKYKWKDRAYG